MNAGVRARHRPGVRPRASRRRLRRARQTPGKASPSRVSCPAVRTTASFGGSGIGTLGDVMATHRVTVPARRRPHPPRPGARRRVAEKSDAEVIADAIAGYLGDRARKGRLSRMMRTADPSVLVSSFLGRAEAAPGRPVAAWRAGRFTLVVSPALHGELDECCAVRSSNAGLQRVAQARAWPVSAARSER